MKKSRHLYVLLIHAPGDAKTVLSRRVSTTPPDIPANGSIVRVRGQKLRVVSTARSTRLGEHGTTREVHVATREVDDNVVAMPAGETLVVADFIRYHVLVRVFGGDADAWLASLEAKASQEDRSSDIRFARWIRSRLRQDPALLETIRRMVDTTPFWPSAEVR